MHVIWNNIIDNVLCVGMAFSRIKALRVWFSRLALLFCPTETYLFFVRLQWNESWLCQKQFIGWETKTLLSQMACQLLLVVKNTAENRWSLYWMRLLLRNAFSGILIQLLKSPIYAVWYFILSFLFTDSILLVLFVGFRSSWYTGRLFIWSNVCFLNSSFFWKMAWS